VPINHSQFHDIERGRRRIAGLPSLIAFAYIIFAQGSATLIGRADEASPPRIDAKTALEKFNSLIGGWRGVGMPKRGSTRGAWKEQATWVWDFNKGRTALQYKVDKGTLIRQATLTFDASTSSYRLNAQFVDGTKRNYTGQLADAKLTLQSSADDSGQRHAIIVTRLNEKRTLVLYQKRTRGATRYRRVAEVGYTRQGTRLAQTGSSGPKCVVTGGEGTSQVSYQGKEYYVCCSGCRQAFEDDPEGIIAAYKQRLAKTKAESPKR